MSVRKQILLQYLLLYGQRELPAELLLSKLPNICSHLVPTFYLNYPTFPLIHPTFLLKFLNKPLNPFC